MIPETLACSKILMLWLSHPRKATECQGLCKRHLSSSLQISAFLATYQIPLNEKEATQSWKICPQSVGGPTPITKLPLQPRGSRLPGFISTLLQKMLAFSTCSFQGNKGPKFPN